MFLATHNAADDIYDFYVLHFSRLVVSLRVLWRHTSLCQCVLNISEAEFLSCGEEEGLVKGGINKAEDEKRIIVIKLLVVVSSHIPVLSGMPNKLQSSHHTS